MKIKSNTSSFQPCPEYTGPAVCVDVTEPKLMQTRFGPKNKFRIVFETALKRTEEEGGGQWPVWSPPFSESLHENSALRKFLKGWFGRDLTSKEIEEGLETEDLIGKKAFINVIHDTSRDGSETYANIAACSPWREGQHEDITPSGKFVRQKDRQGGEYRRTQKPDGAEETEDYLSVKVHVGNYNGVALGELPPAAVGKLIDKWLPKFEAMDKPKADDKRLATALRAWRAEKEENEASGPPTQEEDDIDY